MLGELTWHVMHDSQKLCLSAFHLPSCPVQLLGFLNYNCLRFHVVVLVRCQAPYARVKLLQLWLQPVCMMIMRLSDLLKLKLRLSKA
jgi:hypothetical protein